MYVLSTETHILEVVKQLKGITDNVGWESDGLVMM